MHFALPFCSASANVVALDEVLTAYDPRFQVAVHRILLEQGFEVDGGLPNLQLAMELRDAIGGSLEDQGYGLDWESLDWFLEWADHQGILVDLNLASGHLPATA
jgi:hypothetical protein